MSKAAITALGYIEIGVTQLAAWQSYATEVLGLACKREDNALWLRMDEEVWRHKLVESDTDDITCAGFDLGDDLENLHRVVDQLSAIGVEVTEQNSSAARERGVDQLWACQDPDGLRIELYIGERKDFQEFNSPIGVRGFVTADQGLGHIVLAVSDQEKANAFYLDALGFKLSDHIELGKPGQSIEITFLHCNPRHHTLALAPLPVPQRLNHFLIQVDNIDDVGLSYDRAQAAGHKITSSLGRHTNDRMISYYMKTPSGFDIEFGYGGLEIEEDNWQPGRYYSPSSWGHKPQ